MAIENKIITKGNRAVVISANEEAGPFWATLWVNARNGIQNADITPTMWRGKTMKGAEKWAARQLGD
jgi:hypothetical protein